VPAARIALLVAGAHKAGTTTLYRWLVQHPGLAGHAQPELAFFVDEREWAEGEAAYRRYGPPAAPADGRPFVAKHAKFLHAPAAPERLRAHSPDARLVVLLRHPVERAHSAFGYARARGREPLATFEEALAAEEGRLAAGMPPWHDTAYATNSSYLPALERLERAFPRGLVRVLLSEDLAARGSELVRELYRELGVDAGFAPELARLHNAGRSARSPAFARVLERSRASVARKLVPRALRWRLAERLHAWNRADAAPPPLPPATRALLLERFAPTVDALERRIGRDLSAWRR